MENVASHEKSVTRQLSFVGHAVKRVVKDF